MINISSQIKINICKNTFNYLFLQLNRNVFMKINLFHVASDTWIVREEK